MLYAEYLVDDLGDPPDEIGPGRSPGAPAWLYVSTIPITFLADRSFTAISQS